MQNYIEQRAVDLQAAVAVDEAQFPLKRFMKKLTRERVVPTGSNRVAGYTRVRQLNREACPNVVLRYSARCCAKFGRDSVGRG